MTRPVRVLDPALADVAATLDWYDSRRPGLGDEFVEQFDATIRRIAANPEIFPHTIQDARRARLERFPYSLFYLVQPDEIVVVACLHQRRDPSLVEARVAIGKATSRPS